VMVFLWWCLCGGVSVVVVWWCFCGGVFVFLWWCGGVFCCGEVFVVVWLCLKEIYPATSSPSSVRSSVSSDPNSCK